MTSPFAELRIAAAVESAEAVAANMEDAVRFQIGAIVGVEDTPQSALAMSGDCMFSIGTSSVSNALESVLQSICEGMRDVMFRFFGVADALAQAIRDFIGPFLQSVVQQFTSLVQTVTTRLGNLLFAVMDQVDRMLTTMVTTIRTLVDNLTTAVRQIVNELKDIMGAIFNRIGVMVDAILTKVRDGFSAVLATAQNILARIGDGIGTIIDRLIRVSLDVLGAIGSAIGKIIDPFVNAAEGGLARVRAVIEDIPATMRELVADVSGFVGEKVGGPIAAVGENFITQVEKYHADLIDRLDITPDKIIRDFLTGVGLPAAQVERIASAAGGAMPHTVTFFAMAMGLLVPMLITSVVSTTLSPWLELLRQESQELATPTLIDPASTIEALYRGEIDAATFKLELAKAGYNEQRQDILLRSSRRLLDVGEVFRFWLRGFIDDNQLAQELGHLRIGDADQERLRQAVFFIPPVNDLIQMAVREVFSPEIRERFGQDEGFPEEFAKFGKQQGLSEEWAKAYWAAHWILPSPQQGFEMLHRRVIEPADLDVLLRALDVMPFWREKLTAIAFSPLTRVDLRRMHKLGLFDAEELQRRYEDLGFSKDNAGHMVTFTLAYNADDATEAEAEIEGLTRATVVNMFEDGILAEPEALGILETMGLSPRVAELFIEQRKLEVQRAERSALIESIVSLVGGGVINFPTAQDNLASIGLTATEIAKATRRIVAQFDKRQRLPTPAQLEKMLSLEIISEEQWRETMGGLDFPEEWTERLLTLSQSGGVA